MNYKKLSYPYIIWIALLSMIPLVFMLVLAFTNTDGLNFDGAEFSLSNFYKALEPAYVEAFFNSLKYGFLASVICLLLGYPIAYFMAFSKSKYKIIFPFLVMIPTWNNMLLRVISWEMLFLPNSILNMFGISLDLIGTSTAILIGMVSIYIPFMIIPIYTVLSKVDRKLIEASTDLLSTPFQTFRRVILPLSMTGIISGFIMTFLPSATAFVIPERLSGGKLLLIGNIIENQFITVSNYNFGSMISIILVIIVMSSLFIVNRADKEGDTIR